MKAGGLEVASCRSVAAYVCPGPSAAGVWGARS